MTVQDDRGSRKKAWKAFQANYDDVFALSDRLCSYCLSDQMIQALLTMTEYLKWSSRWVSAAGDVDPDTINLFASQLEYRLMNGCCDDNLPIQWRYTSDGVLQQSLNGGITWTDAPLYDPRVYSTQFPPIPGASSADKRCIAATGAAALIKEQIGDQLTDDMTRYQLSQLITDWVRTMIDTSNPFQALVTVVANQVFALIIALLRPALTDTVYHLLTCAFNCNMSNDITFDLAQWQQVRSDITGTIGGIAGIFLEHLVYLLGTQGITNLCRAGGATSGDCSDCDCDFCYSWDFALSDGDWYTNEHWPGGGTAGAVYAGGWHSAHPGGSAAASSTDYIVYDLPASINVSRIIITFANSGMTNDAGDATGAIADGSPATITINAARTQFVLYFYDPSGTGSMTISGVEMHSDEPFPDGLTGGETC